MTFCWECRKPKNNTRPHASRVLTAQVSSAEQLKEGAKEPDRINAKQRYAICCFVMRFPCASPTRCYHSCSSGPDKQQCRIHATSIRHAAPLLLRRTLGKAAAASRLLRSLATSHAALAPGGSLPAAAAASLARAAEGAAVTCRDAADAAKAIGNDAVAKARYVRGDLGFGVCCSGVECVVGCGHVCVCHVQGSRERLLCLRVRAHTCTKLSSDQCALQHHAKRSKRNLHRSHQQAP